MLLKFKPQHWDQLTRQRDMSAFIPYSSHLTHDTLVTKQGDFMRTWRIAGISFETVELEDIGIYKEQLNTMLRSISSGHVTLWTHNVRRLTHDKLEGIFENNFCQRLNDKYYDTLGADYRMMANEFYLTLIYRPYPKRVDRAIVKAARRSLEEIKNEQKETLRQLDQIAEKIESSMKIYGVDRNGIEKLTIYQDDTDATCSRLLEFLNFLLSGEWQKVRVPSGPLADYLGTSWIFTGAETVEVRGPTKSRFLQGLDFKDYRSHTEPGVLNDLLYVPFEYVITQSFSCMSQRDGKAYLERQQRQLTNAEDGSLTQIEEMGHAIDELIQGLFVMGEYHYSLMIYADNIESLRRYVAAASTLIGNRGFLAASISIAIDAAYYAQLPANWEYRPRIAYLTSRNFASLACFHNFRAGKRDGNPWGQAVTLFRTPSGQPLYFNFHYAKGDEDDFDKKVLGSTRIIGQSGAGKTVLMTFLLCQLQKYRVHSPTGFTTIFFDYGRGAELLIRAIGGEYFTFKNGESTALNPFQLEPTEENKLFLKKLVYILVSSNGTRPVSVQEEGRLNAAIDTVMEMPKFKRRLSVVLQNIPEGSTREERESSVTRRLANWCVDDGSGKRGQFWWVFDNPTDRIDFTANVNFGFDGTQFLDNPDIRTPLSFYLLFRMESVIDGRRFVYLMDEAWKWVDDEAFAKFAGESQVTIRKKNGFGVFATQMPGSFLKSRIAESLVQQCATEIYLPNPKASYEDYVEGFKCSPKEYALIRSWGEDARRFLVKQGQQSMIGVLDLRGFDDELAVLSGSTDHVELVDEIMQETGQDPERWLPIFHTRRKERLKLKPSGGN